jgi:2,7-dihydroxy-5-methyl-1-naphthoate 7-O-methyltransferase
MAGEATGWGGELWAAADLVTPMAIRVAATLRLADHIAAGPQTAAALAAAVHADPDTLRRLPGHLVTAGVLSRDGRHLPRLTALGERLRDDDPAGVRPWLDLEGAVGRARGSGRLPLGCPGPRRRRGRRQRQPAHRHPPRLWRPARDGDRPARPGVPRRAGPRRGRPGRAGRLPGGQLLRCPLTFLGVPGAGGYVLSGVLHDWADEDALRILQRCADAAGPAGKVLVVDPLGGAGNGTAHTEGDLRMLCHVRGHERSLGELTGLARAAGLQAGSVFPAGSRPIIELRRAP